MTTCPLLGLPPRVVVVWLLPLDALVSFNVLPNLLHLREAGISTNTVPKVSNVEKLKYVLLAPSKSPSVQSVCQPNEEKMS